MDPSSILSQFDPRLAPLLGWVAYAVKVTTDWVKTALVLPKWAPPLIAFGSGVVLLVLLMLALGIGLTAQLVAQAVILAVLAAGLAIGATAMQSRAKSSVSDEKPAPVVIAGNGMTLVQIVDELERRANLRNVANPADHVVALIDQDERRKQGERDAAD